MASWAVMLALWGGSSPTPPVLPPTRGAEPAPAASGVIDLRDPFVQPKAPHRTAAQSSERVVVSQLDLQDPFRGPQGAPAPAPVAVPAPAPSLDLRDPFADGARRWQACAPRRAASGVVVQRAGNVASVCEAAPGPLRNPFPPAAD